MATKNPEFAKTKTIATPVGRAVFAWLTKADTKYDSDGVYRTNLALDPADPKFASFKETLDTIRKEAVAAVKAVNGNKKVKSAAVFTKETDEDGEETGLILIKAKTAAVRKGKDGRTAKVELTIVDAAKNPHPKKDAVYSGSRLRLAVWPRPVLVKGELFITLYIVSVQVIELVSGGDAIDLFDKEEGYEAAAAEESDPFDDGDDDDDDAESEGDDDGMY